MTKSIDAIRGDLNTLAKLLRAVDFAVESFEEHDKRKAENRKLDSAIEGGKEELKKIKAQVATQAAKNKSLEEAAGTIIKKAEDQAAEIVAEAKNKAGDLIGEARDRVDQVKVLEGKHQKAVDSLDAEIKELTAKRDSLKKERDALAGSLQKSLSAVQS